MEYLRTPDLTARHGIVPTPSVDGVTSQPHDRHDIRSSFQSLFSPLESGTAPQTPALASHHPYQFPGLTPFLGTVTPALAGGASGTGSAFAPTPFGSGPAIAGGILTPHHHGSMGISFGSTQSPRLMGTPAQDVGSLTSPFLQAAAKEAVRREFMSMPSYLNSDAGSNRPSGDAADNEKRLDDNVTSASNEFSTNTSKTLQANCSNSTSPEQRIPDNDHSKKNQVAAASQQGQPSLPQQMPMLPYPFSTYPGMMYMPYPGVMPQHPGFQTVNQHMGVFPPSGFPGAPGMALGNEGIISSVGSDPRPDEGNKAKGGKDDSDRSSDSAKDRATASAAVQQQQQQMAAAQGMMIMGPNGPVFVPPPQFAFGQPPHMMMQRNPAMAAVVAAATAAANPSSSSETPAQKKERVETEKQELIREFKKKTREAALVRFRQKRRERRFGKLIRYDCRKKLADARPRIKGRFVRIKDGDEDGEEIDEMQSPESLAQVVPDLAIGN